MQYHYSNSVSVEKAYLDTAVQTYLRNSGELLTNNWKQGKDGKWYFCGKNGNMATSKIID